MAMGDRKTCFLVNIDAFYMVFLILAKKLLISIGNLIELYL